MPTQLRQLRKTSKSNSINLLVVIRHSLVLLAFTFGYLSAVAQLGTLERFLDSTSLTQYDDIVIELEAYYANRDKGKGSGYADFKRWEHWTMFSLNEDGTFPNVAKFNWDNYFEYKNNKARSGDRDNVAGNWVDIGPIYYGLLGNGYSGGLGRINYITTDPDDDYIIYSGSRSGGVWRSLDDGVTWTNITEGFGFITDVDGIAIDPTSPVGNRTIYLMVGYVGLLKSIDNGTTWNTTSFTTPGYVRMLKHHPTNAGELFLCSTSSQKNGIWKSTDGGASFTEVYPSGILDFEFKPGDPTIMYASDHNSNYFRSSDGGDTWGQLTTGLSSITGTGNLYIDVSDAAPNNVYLFSNRSTDFNSTLYSAIFRSTDSGLSFVQQTTSPSTVEPDISVNTNCFAVSDVNPNYMHFGNIDAYRTVNGGQNWEKSSWWVETSPQAQSGRYTHADMRYMECIGNRLYIGSDGGTFSSNDEGFYYIDHSGGMAIAELYQLSCDQNDAGKVVYGSQDNGTMLVENKYGGQIFGADGMHCIVDPTNSNIIYLEYQYGGMKKSINGGQSAFSCDPGVGNGPWVTRFDLDPTNSSKIVVGYTDVYLSDNGATTWNQISFNLAPSNTQCLAVEMAGPNDIYVSKNTGDNFYHGAYNGNNWQWQDIFPGLAAGRRVTFVDVDENDPDRLWVTLNGTTAGQKVYKSTDGGSTWTNISYDLPNLSLYCLIYDQTSVEKLYVAAYPGVFYYDEPNQTWIEYTDSLPVVSVRSLDIQYDKRKLRAGTWGRGVWESDLYGEEDTTNTGIHQISGSFEGPMPGLLMSIDENTTGMVIYPNPVSVSSNIEFSVPMDATISLSVSDIQGRVVNNLVNDMQVRAGRYRTTINGSTLGAQQTYFCTLTINGETSQVTKFIYAR